MIYNKLYRSWMTCMGLIVALWAGSVCEARAQEAQTPRLRRTTIDLATQRYRLDWVAPTDSNNFSYYHIGRRIDGPTGGYVLTDQFSEFYSATWGQHTYLFDESEVRCCEPQAFAVRAFYSSSGDPVWCEGFQSMQQSVPVLDTCAQSFTLSWTPYNKISSFTFFAISSFEHDLQYLVFACDSDVFDHTKMYYYGSSGNSKSFVQKHLEGKKKIHFVIATVYNDGADTSYSNVQTLSYDFPMNPQLTIDSLISRGAQNNIYFTISPNTDYTDFIVERSVSPDTGFTAIASLHNKFAKLSTDNAGNSRAYYYRISVLNECQTIIYSSLPIGSLHAEVVSDEFGITIRWNAVQNDTTNVTKFYVHRTLPDVKSLIPTTQLWLSDVDIEIRDNTNYCYYVKAEVTNQDEKKIAEVLSDVVCYEPVPIWFMPNAVAPFSNVVNHKTGAARNTFQPVCNKKYTFWLKIYNRWGKEVYSGDIGWNGRATTIGEDAPEGTYAYWIQMKFANGKTEEKTGSVTVIWSE